MPIVPFSQVHHCDLEVGNVYEGGSTGNLGDEVLSKLVPGTGNQSGFRIAGRPRSNPKFVVLYSDGEHADWPDYADTIANRWLYFGDNITPGNAITDTKQGGNALLKSVFSDIHATPRRLDRIPPFFVFKKRVTPNSSRSAEFLGLAVPGSAGMPAAHDLITISHSKDGQTPRLNYRATFTFLKASTIQRSWLLQLNNLGRQATKDAPPEWIAWVTSMNYPV
jgi:hypothetical protein